MDLFINIPLIENNFWQIDANTENISRHVFSSHQFC